MASSWDGTTQYGVLEHGIINVKCNMVSYNMFDRRSLSNLLRHSRTTVYVCLLEQHNIR